MSEDDGKRNGSWKSLPMDTLLFALEGLANVVFGRNDDEEDEEHEENEEDE